MEDKERRQEDTNSSHSDRVTLKKEIGLLSACAIIIGECVRLKIIRARGAALPRREKLTGRRVAGGMTAVTWQRRVLKLHFQGTQCESATELGQGCCWSRSAVSVQ